MEKDIKAAVLKAMSDAAQSKGATPQSALADGLIELTRQVAKMQEDVAYAHSWVCQLQKRPELRYVGTWKSDRTYHHGHFVTAHGSLWHCGRDNTAGQEPGTGPDWVLAVKGAR